MSRAAELRDEAADALYALGWTVVKRMPEGMARLVFQKVADRTWASRGAGVRQLEKNLARVLGTTPQDPRVRRLSRASMRSYLRYWLESFRLPVMGGERIVSGMNVTGHEQIHKAVGEGRGVVLALPHMGNYDHAGAWLVLVGHPLTTVAERLKPESLFERFVAYRESLGFEILPLTGSDVSVFGVLARRLRQARVVCLVADRDLTGPAETVAEGARAAFEDARRDWQLLTAAQLVGVAARSLEIGVEYVRERRVFGRPVGSFQTVAHRLADHATAVDGARLLVREAAWAVDEGDPRAAGLAAMAFCFAAEQAVAVAGDSLHFHGGYGFTLEYDIQLYYRRAQAHPLVWGSVQREYQRLADLLFGAAGREAGS